MSHRNNNLKSIALGVAFLTVLLGIYWQGSSIFVQNLHLGVNSTEEQVVTVSTERFAELKKAAAMTEQLRAERDALRAQLLGTSTPVVSDSKTRYLTSVIGRPPQSPYDTFIIDSGEQEGVILGAAAWWPPGIYLGEVVVVNENSSVVELISASNVSHSAVIDGIPVVLKGRGGDGMYADVPASLEVPIGAVAVSEQYNLPVGVVVAKKDLATTDQQRLYIVRHVSNSAIEDVYIE